MDITEYFDNAVNLSSKFENILENLESTNDIGECENIIKSSKLTILQWRLRTLLTKNENSEEHYSICTEEELCSSNDSSLDIESFDEIIQEQDNDSNTQSDFSASSDSFSEVKRTEESDEDIHLPDIGFLLTDFEMLELFLNSGNILEGRWLKAINILSSIVREDVKTLTSSYRKRLAVAVALTFSSPVFFFPSYDEETFSPIERYTTFTMWEQEGKLYCEHSNLSCWLLRHVVDSWFSKNDMEWARTNVPAEFNNIDMVGEATHKMVAYNLFNHCGVSVQDSKPFYDYKPCTLELLTEYGAVCGGISKFGVAMCQAFGIPAFPIAQPGHCAFLWWKQGDWTMSNGTHGITDSITHDKIHWIWRLRCDYQLLFDRTQKNFKAYCLSEQIRWLSKQCTNPFMSIQLLNRALEICPDNFAVWRQLVKLTKTHRQEMDSDTALRKSLKTWLKTKHCELINPEDCTDNLSLYATSITSSVMERAQNVLDLTGSEWYCHEKEGWIELDLGKECYIASVEIQWWGISFAKQYSIHVATGESGSKFRMVKEHTDAFENPESENDYNGWSILGGWTKPTRRIRLDMKNGCLDPWDMNIQIGVRQFNVSGRVLSEEFIDGDLAKYLDQRIKRHFQDFPQIGKDLVKKLVYRKKERKYCTLV